MEKLLNYISEIAKSLHVPIVVGGYFHLLSQKELPKESKKPDTKQIWGDNIPHFIFSDK